MNSVEIRGSEIFKTFFMRIQHEINFKYRNGANKIREIPDLAHHSQSVILQINIKML